VKQLFRIWQRAKAIVKNRERDHHQHRRQNESRDSYSGSAPATHFQPHIGCSVTRGRARQALPESEAGGKFLLREPVSLLHRESSDVGNYGQSTAEANQANF